MESKGILESRRIKGMAMSGVLSALGSILVLVSIASPAWAAGASSIVRISLWDLPPPPLPAYDIRFREHGVQGTMALLATFSQAGKIVELEVKSSQLTGDWDSGRYGKLETAVFESVAPFVKQWRSFVAETPPTQISIELELDPTLTPKERRFDVEYGEHPVIERLRIVAPPAAP